LTHFIEGDNGQKIKTGRTRKKSAQGSFIVADERKRKKEERQHPI